ncbi:Uma2 family endonuclease [Actinoplanes sp. NPDC049118]|uniref:Uma2 family endonuclease n=1 Tax=Actinoplanes sp. NPDC049118 TaxID=3155769 RepID=UPI0033F3BF05
MTASLRLADLHPAELDLLRRDDLTVDDIVNLPEDLHYELIDGRLVLTPLAFPIHQLLGMKTAVAIEERRPDTFIINIEQAILIDRRNELRPDVVLIREEGAGYSPVLPADVPLVVEVISKSSKTSDRELKLKKYAYAGIPSYWIIDPLAERVTFTQFCLGPGGVYERRHQTDEVVTVDQPWEITLDLPAWTRKRDRILRVARRDR